MSPGISEVCGAVGGFDCPKCFPSPPQALPRLSQVRPTTLPSASQGPPTSLPPPSLGLPAASRPPKKPNLLLWSTPQSPLMPYKSKTLPSDIMLYLLLTPQLHTCIKLFLYKFQIVLFWIAKQLDFFMHNTTISTFGCAFDSAFFISLQLLCPMIALSIVRIHPVRGVDPYMIIPKTKVQVYTLRMFLVGRRQRFSHILAHPQITSGRSQYIAFLNTKSHHLILRTGYPRLVSSTTIRDAVFLDSQTHVIAG